MTEGLKPETLTRERIDLIKKTVCPKGITDDEFALFIEQCRRSGLDPLIKEAFCVPRRKNIGNKERPNWVTIHEFQPSEAGMLARAEDFPDHEGVTAAAVYVKDKCVLEPDEGKVTHQFSPGDRGHLLGAWAKVRRKGRTPCVVWLDVAGYEQQTPMWNKLAPTMIEKCARVASLRKAYPGPFGGLYIKDEMPADELPEGSAQAALPEMSVVTTGFMRVDVPAAQQSVEAPKPTPPATRKLIIEDKTGGDVKPQTKNEQVKAQLKAKLGVADMKSKTAYERAVDMAAAIGVPEDEVRAMLKTFGAATSTAVTGMHLAKLQAQLETPPREPGSDDDTPKAADAAF